MKMLRQRLFQMVLFAYPREFRHEYGREMEQLFGDCYRAERKNRGRLGVGGLWVRTLVDLARAAPREHLENLGKDNAIMKNLGKNALAFLGSIALIVIAFLLLSYGRKHEISTILIFGRILDALVTAGIIGNLLIFLFMTITRLNPLRIALWTLLVVNGALLLLTIVVGSKVDPSFSLSGVILGYVVSFLFWFSLHWLWSKASAARAVSTES
jgi:heme/copper-type cytochrome/quinol oxidase subunit 4